MAYAAGMIGNTLIAKTTGKVSYADRKCIVETLVDMDDAKNADEIVIDHRHCEIVHDDEESFNFGLFIRTLKFKRPNIDIFVLTAKGQRR